MTLADPALANSQPAASPVAGLPDAGRGGPIARFIAGVTCAIGGVRFTLSHRALIGWALLAMLVQAALFVGLLLVGWRHLDGWSAWLTSHPDRWYAALAPVMRWILGAVIVAGAALGAMLGGSVLCDPLHDLLSETTEAILVGRNVESSRGLAGMVRGVLRELVATLWRLGLYLGGTVLLFVVGLTGVGSLVAAPASMAWTWLFVAAEVLSRSQGRHSEGARARMSGVMQHRALALGFGAGGWLLTWIPLSTPFLTVGGTRLHLALAAWDRLPSRLSADDKARLRGESA